MCGIVAALSTRGPLAPDALRGALDALVHRGPDGEGTAQLAGGAVALGHRRLALVDPAGGAQPLASEDGRVVAVVNGEFYDEGDALRRDLEARGHSFRTASDSELLVHLFEEFGPDAIARLVGEFAFALFDARDGRLWLGRDRFGVKPLVWARTAWGVVAASEAKALFALGVPANWDGMGFAHAVRHQYLPPRVTLFEGVRALSPGTLLGVDAHGRIEERRYAHLAPLAEDAPTGSEGDFAERAAEFRARLERAVRARLRGDASVAFALSGGLDSASVVALAREALGGRAPACFGVVFDRAPFDERDAMRTTARHLGATLCEVEVSTHDMLALLPDAVSGAEGLASNGQLPAKLALARAIRAAGHPVVLTGEGADEALLGYAHLRAEAGPEAPFAAETLRSIARDHGASRGLMLPGAGAAGASLGALGALLGGAPAFLAAKAAVGDAIAPLLSSPWRRVDAFGALGEALCAEVDFRPVPSAPPLARATWLWTRLALAGYVLRTLGDGTEMAASVEGRPPFLDADLFAFATALPLADKLRPPDKASLRAALARDLPAATLARPKHPFLAPPIAAALGAPDALRELLEATVPELPFVEAAAARRWIADSFAGPLDDDPRATRAPMTMMLLTAGLLQRELRLGAPSHEPD